MSAFQAKLIEGKLTKDEIEQAAKEGNFISSYLMKHLNPKVMLAIKKYLPYSKR